MCAEVECGSKKCTKCGEEKAFAFYHKNSKAKDGLRRECKQCKSIASKKYYKSKVKVAKVAKVARVARVAMDLRVQEATKHVLDELDITTQAEFFAWRAENGGPKGFLSHTDFYCRVERISLTHWNSLRTPRSSCISAYESILPGYKQYKA